MLRIAGVDLPEQKPVQIALRYLYGIGPQLSLDILKICKIPPTKRARDLSSDEVTRIQREVEKYNIEGNLRRLVRENIDHLKRIASYRGLRHRQGLPSRGQRTRSNARTTRGRRKTVGSMTKEMAAKLDTVKKS